MALASHLAYSAAARIKASQARCKPKFLVALAGPMWPRACELGMEASCWPSAPAVRRYTYTFLSVHLCLNVVVIACGHEFFYACDCGCGGHRTSGEAGIEGSLLARLEVQGWKSRGVEVLGLMRFMIQLG